MRTLVSALAFIASALLLAACGSADAPVEAQPKPSETIWEEYGDQLSELQGGECAMWELKADCVKITPDRVALVRDIRPKLGNLPMTENVDLAIFHAGLILQKASTFTDNKCKSASLKKSMTRPASYCSESSYDIQDHFDHVRTLVESIG